jgi:hypothetical protein
MPPLSPPFCSFILDPDSWLLKCINRWQGEEVSLPPPLPPAPLRIILSQPYVEKHIITSTPILPPTPTPSTFITEEDEMLIAGLILPGTSAEEEGLEGEGFNLEAALETNTTTGRYTLLCFFIYINDFMYRYVLMILMMSLTNQFMYVYMYIYTCV